MKNYPVFIILIAVSLIIIPVIFVGSNPTDKTDGSENPTTAKAEASTEEESTASEITVFLSKSKKASTVSAFEYVCGSVAAEMPLSYCDEALKAQAVACYTNAIRLKSALSDGDNELNGADISDDSGVHQGYIDKKAREKKWGDSYEKYEKKLENAVNDVLGETVTYDGKLCIASFFALCGGTTENAENVWGNKIPYLVSVKSSGDTLSPNYLSTVTFSKSQFTEVSKKLGTTISDEADLTEIIKAKKISDAGTVLSIKIDGDEYTGAEIREAFSLKSASFDTECKEDSVTFKVKGYGHAVGMSQYGADYMAHQGSTYREILKHYYKGAEIN